ncbi:MAG TPA: B12-binding domain-containing radical SAM protein [Chloroflexi bacterium]|jgi:anaerobic magnesium-protoporphyrin IX monomethyl ester cyclase|nr:B12-binding domain-containing radical SAM protein [Chloroflexota bacterium]
MRVSLVYPGIVGKGFDSIGQGMDSGWISHGLAILAPCAVQAGHDVNLIDLRALKGWDHFRATVAQRRPDVVAVTMMSVDYNPGMRCLEIVRAVDPKIITMVGGPHPTIMPDELANHPHVDHVFMGEGEETFPDALNRLARGEALPRIIPGTHPDLDAVPYADRNLFPDEWRRQGYTVTSPEASFVEELPPPFVTIIAGRGCMYNCSYCQPAERHIFGRKVRRRSVASVMGELRELRARYRFNSLMFHDDCLTEDREWVEAFCRAYAAEGFTQPFFCQSRADIIVKNEDMVALMARTGLRGYFIGFESGSDRVLRFIRKGTRRWHNLEAARICRRYGISIWANYMMGIPTETKEEVLETISMLKEIDPDYYSPAFYTPHPGSDLYDYCMEHNLSLIRNHDSYRRNPDEAKIKGIDYEWLAWAVAESQRRTWPNRLRRAIRALWRRYAHPYKVVRRLMMRHQPTTAT